MYRVRLFQPTPDEYDAIVVVHRAAWPDARHASTSAWQESDAEVPPGAVFQRIVAERDGAIVAEGSCYEAFWGHHPDAIHLEWNIHPNHANAALDALLFERLVALAHERAPGATVLAAETREDRPERITFLQNRGFSLEMRSPRSALDVEAAATPDLQAVAAQQATQGIEILALGEFQAREAGWRRALYGLRCAIIMDVPSVEPQVPPTMEEFEAQVLDDPALDATAWFLAADAGQATNGAPGPLVGMSNLWLNDPERERLDAGLTGVLRAYRRRGIARALKLHTIAFAQSVGARTIATANEERNPMYQLNLQLGFRPLPALLSYRKGVTS